MVFDFSTFPTLTTTRLNLRELQPEDAPDVFVFRSDPEVQKYNDVPMQDISEAETFISELLHGYKNRQLIIWAITFPAEDVVIGLCGFNYWNLYHSRAEIGYDLALAWWGQGIGTEAVGEMVRFGFEEMYLNRIEAGTIADNHGSVRLLEKLGFQREGTRRKHSWEEDGTYHDSAIYGLLREEWVADHPADG